MGRRLVGLRVLATLQERCKRLGQITRLPDRIRYIVASGGGFSLGLLRQQREEVLLLDLNSLLGVAGT